MTPAEIRPAVEVRRQELINLAQQLIEFETMSPPEGNTVKAQSFIADYLRQLGFAVDQFDVYPGDPNVVGRLVGIYAARSTSFLINGHIDVALSRCPGLMSRSHSIIC